MNKIFLFFILLLTFGHCSLDTKTGLWTKNKIEQEKNDNLQQIFKSAEILEKEFNSNLKLKIKSI